MAKKSKRKRDETAEKVEDSKPSATSASSIAEIGSKPSKAQKKSAFDDIDDMFQSKKERIKNEKEIEAEEERREMEKREFFKKNNVSTSSAPNTANAKKVALSGDRRDCAELSKNDWVDDGRGGIFNADGFTGRQEEGVKVFKAHLFNKKGFGTTKDCPFDCDCCYI